MNVEINIIEQKPEPEPVADLDDILRAADQTLMAFGQRLEDRAEGGQVTMEDILDVLRGMFGEACGKIGEIQEDEENGDI